MKVKKISQFGFTTDADDNKWNNYANDYAGYKLVKGQDFDKNIEFQLDAKGKVISMQFGDLGMAPPVATPEPKETIAAVAGVPVKAEGIRVKVISSEDLQTWESEINDWNGKFKVVATQTLFAGARFVAVLYYAI